MVRGTTPFQREDTPSVLTTLLRILTTFPLFCSPTLDWSRVLATSKGQARTAPVIPVELWGK